MLISAVEKQLQNDRAEHGQWQDGEYQGNMSLISNAMYCNIHDNVYSIQNVQSKMAE